MSEYQGRRLAPLRSLALIASLLLAMGIAGCVGLSSTTSGVLGTRPEQRYTDFLIVEDWRRIEALSARLEQRRGQMQPYAAYKAGFLIEFAIDEYNENDRSGVVAWALDTARNLIDAPDADAEQELARHFPPLGRYDAFGLLVLDSEERRVLLEAQQRLSALPPCAAEALARYHVGALELAHERWEVLVGLVKAGHENPAIERLTARRRTLETMLKAAESSETCTPDTSAPPVVVPRPPRPERVPAPEPVPAPTPPAAPLNSINVLFEYDGYTRADVLPGDLDLLQRVAEQWLQSAARRAGSLMLPIRLVGHADRVGSVSYNHRLAWRRAQTVRALLIEHGIPGDRIEINVMGSARPITVCNAPDVDEQLINCLAPDRRVEVILPFAASSLPGARQ